MKPERRKLLGHLPCIGHLTVLGPAEDGKVLVDYEIRPRDVQKGQPVCWVLDRSAITEEQLRDWTGKGFRQP